ncbi:hypothetical protein EYS14_03420 [Alteromonadaceae bacterium M269]|nr:hypothetical protein EYS14_03420 [Alteromonadaceae bacterium M269]
MHKRFGVFYIGLDIINNDVSLASKIFSFLNAVPYGMERQWDKHRIKYEAISPMFDEVGQIQDTPSYTIRITQDDDGTKHIGLTKDFKEGELALTSLQRVKS